MNSKPQIIEIKDGKEIEPSDFIDNNKIEEEFENNKINKANSERCKDLLKLEKDYFDGVYHENNDEDVKSFKIKQLLKKDKKETKKKPEITNFLKSDRINY